jgi:hypothetical protein
MRGERDEVLGLLQSVVDAYNSGDSDALATKMQDARHFFHAQHLPKR